MQKTNKINFDGYGVLPVIRKKKTCSVWLADSICSTLKRVCLMGMKEGNQARLFYRTSFRAKVRYRSCEKSASQTRIFLCCKVLPQTESHRTNKVCRRNLSLFQFTTNKEWFQNTKLKISVNVDCGVGFLVVDRHLSSRRTCTCSTGCDRNNIAWQTQSTRFNQYFMQSFQRRWTSEVQTKPKQLYHVWNKKIICKFYALYLPVSFVVIGVVAGRRVFDGPLVAPSETVSGHAESCRLAVVATRVVVDKLGDNIIPMIFALLVEQSAVFLEFQRVCSD